MNYYTAPAKKFNYTQDFIHETVCNYFNVDPKSILVDKKTNDIIYPRFLSMYFQRNLIWNNGSPLSLKTIGRFFNKKCHTTIRNALKQVKNLSETWDEFREHKENLQRLFKVEMIKKTA